MSDGTDHVVSLLNVYAASEAGKERIWRVSGPTTAAIKMPNGNYKSTKFNGDEEFIFRGVRKGARRIIMEFEPVASAEYTTAEWVHGKVFNAFVGFEDALTAALHSKASTFNSAIAGIRRSSSGTPISAPSDDATSVESDVVHMPPDYKANDDWGSF